MSAISNIFEVKVRNVMKVARPALCVNTLRFRFLSLEAGSLFPSPFFILFYCAAKNACMTSSIFFHDSFLANLFDEERLARPRTIFIFGAVFVDCRPRCWELAHLRVLPPAATIV